VDRYDRDDDQRRRARLDREQRGWPWSA